MKPLTNFRHPARSAPVLAGLASVWLGAVACSPTPTLTAAPPLGLYVIGPRLASSHRPVRLPVYALPISLELHGLHVRVRAGDCTARVEQVPGWAVVVEARAATSCWLELEGRTGETFGRDEVTIELVDARPLLPGAPVWAPCGSSTPLSLAIPIDGATWCPRWSNHGGDASAIVRDGEPEEALEFGVYVALDADHVLTCGEDACEARRADLSVTATLAIGCHRRNECEFSPVAGGTFLQWSTSEQQTEVRSIRWDGARFEPGAKFTFPRSVRGGQAAVAWSPDLLVLWSTDAADPPVATLRFILASTGEVVGTRTDGLSQHPMRVGEHVWYRGRLARTPAELLDGSGPPVALGLELTSRGCLVARVSEAGVRGQVLELLDVCVDPERPIGLGWADVGIYDLAFDADGVVVRAGDGEVERWELAD